MKLADFDFDLPPALIAQRPARPRDSARLLAIGDAFRDLGVRDLPDLLRPGDVLVVNDTRVVPSRLVGRRGAARIEATLYQRIEDRLWRAFVKPARKLKLGDRVEFAPDLAAAVAAKVGGDITLRFDRTGADVRSELERHGLMPLPPYIKRPPEGDPGDRADYQTLFARREGAVAAPTAGLHFTPELLAAIERRGVKRATVTLHVGAGTFLPVKTENVADHKMHPEWGEIAAATADAINDARADGGRVVAVGSTALRLLETAADAGGRVRPFAGETDLFILPSYRFKAADALITNFHLPRSTLFMLVAAFAGLARMKAAYEHAKARGYRFYSYGDCCFIERATQ